MPGLGSRAFCREVVRQVQRVVGVGVDGYIGPDTERGLERFCVSENIAPSRLLIELGEGAELADSYIVSDEHTAIIREPSKKIKHLVPELGAKWMIIARSKIGLTEAPGKADNPKLMEIFNEAGFSYFKHDSTPWCSIFWCWVIMKADLKHTHSAAARSWRTWGQKIWEIGDTPHPPVPIAIPHGATMVFWRGGDPDGLAKHVAGYDATAKTRDGMYACLGGNQSDKVRVAYQHQHRIQSIRWPSEVELPDLTKIHGDKKHVA